MSVRTRDAEFDQDIELRIGREQRSGGMQRATQSTLDSRHMAPSDSSNLNTSYWTLVRGDSYQFRVPYAGKRPLARSRDLF
jgi:hypothetical protein